MSLGYRAALVDLRVPRRCPLFIVMVVYARCRILPLRPSISLQLWGLQKFRWLARLDSVCTRPDFGHRFQAQAPGGRGSRQARTTKKLQLQMLTCRLLQTSAPKCGRDGPALVEPEPRCRDEALALWDRWERHSRPLPAVHP